MAKFALVTIAVVDACTVKIEEFSDNKCSSLKKSHTVACGGCDQSYIRYDCVGGKAKGTLYKGGGCSGSVTGETTYTASTCYNHPAQGDKSPGYHFSCSGASVNQTSEASIGVHVPNGLIVDLTPEEMEAQMALNEQYEKESIEGNYVGPENITFGYSFTKCNQKCTNWCWATGATMAASAFTGVSCNSDEESVAEYIYGTPCSTSCPSNCNQGGTTANIASGVKHLSGHSYSSGGVLSQSSLDSALQHGPVVVGVQWSLGGGHAITIHGKSGGKYQIHDPENEEHTVEYSGVTTYKPNYASGSYTGKWFGSAYTNSGELAVEKSVEVV